MKWMFYLLLVAFFCKCITPPPYTETEPPPPLPELPDKELEEISIEGVYFHGDSKEERERKLADKEIVKMIENCPTEELGMTYYNEELDEWIEFSCSYFTRNYKVKEPYFQYVIWEHCYQKKEKTGPVFDKNVLFRLYDKKGNKLAEDHLRINGHNDSVSVSLITYLPYMKSAYETRVVRLVGNKEIVLAKQKFEDKAFLSAESLYTTKKGRQCHRGGYIPDL